MYVKSHETTITRAPRRMPSVSPGVTSVASSGRPYAMSRMKPKYSTTIVTVSVIAIRRRCAARARSRSSCAAPAVLPIGGLATMAPVRMRSRVSVAARGDAGCRRFQRGTDLADLERVPGLVLPDEEDVLVQIEIAK